MPDSRLHVVKVALNLELDVPIKLMQESLPASVEALGERVAEQVAAYCDQNSLNYYPALDYLIEQNAIDAYLVDALEEVSTVAVSICTREIKELLMPVFSSVLIEAIQCLAYSMPACRPGKDANLHKQALNLLAHHYTPTTIRLQLVLSSLQREKVKGGFEKYVSHTVHRWLTETFETPQISAARIIDD